MSSGGRPLSTELGTISEAAISDRKWSGSPEPIRDSIESARGPGPAKNSSANACHSRISSGEDYTRPRKVVISLPTSRANTGEGFSDGSGQRGPPTAAYDDPRVGIDSGVAHPDYRHTQAFNRPASRKSTGENTPIFQKPARQFTTVTNASASFEETEVWDSKAILALDGGGIRGYSSLLVLKELMNKIAKLEREHPHGPAVTSFHPLPPAPRHASNVSSANSQSPVTVEKITLDPSQWLPCHYFDYIAGTSTGGLISIMLGRLRMNVDDCIADYEKLGYEVFGHCRWFHLRSPLFWPRDKYNHKTLQNVVKRVVNDRVPRVASFPGGRNFAYDENRCRTIVISYQKRTEEGIEKPYIFRTYKNLHKSPPNSAQSALDRNPDLAQDIPIWKVARATTAAPTYFEPAKIDGLEYVDGGFGANNPSQEAYREVRKMNNNSPKAIGLLLSIGTGENNAPSRFTDGSVLLKYLNYVNFMKKWATDSQKTHVDMVATSDEAKFRYYRLNVDKGIGAMKLDEWKTRGKLRRELGIVIGRLRGASPEVEGPEKPLAPGETEVERKVNKMNASRGDAMLRIPEWLTARNKTIEQITDCTNAYLKTEKANGWLDECAKILVDSRRLRVQADKDRWERACFGAWYQCTQDQCPRGEKEYENRDSLRRHFLDKHRNMFTRSAVDDFKLEKALDDCKILVQ